MSSHSATLSSTPQQVSEFRPGCRRAVLSLLSCIPLCEPSDARTPSPRTPAGFPAWRLHEPDRVPSGHERSVLRVLCRAEEARTFPQVWPRPAVPDSGSGGCRRGPRWLRGCTLASAVGIPAAPRSLGISPVSISYISRSSGLKWHLAAALICLSLVTHDVMIRYHH